MKISTGGGIEQSSHVGSVIESTVVEAVPMNGFADAIAVKMGRDYDVFVLERRIGARENTQDVVGGDV